MVKYSKLDLTLQTTIKNDEVLKYTGKLHLPLQTTIRNDEILKYTGKLHLPLQTMLVNLRKSSGKKLFDL